MLVPASATQQRAAGDYVNHGRDVRAVEHAATA